MDFKFEFSTLKLGKNGYFCACLNFFVNQCYYMRGATEWKTNKTPYNFNNGLKAKITAAFTDLKNDTP